MSRYHTVRLTKQQLWAVANSYDAAFTAPEEMNRVERTAGERLWRAYIKACEAERVSA